MEHSLKQLVTLTLDLSSEWQLGIGQCEIHLMILADRQRIATDIRTGFPQLVREDRVVIHQLVYNIVDALKAKDYYQTLRPLQQVDQVLIELEPALRKYMAIQGTLSLDSLSVQVYAEGH